MIKKKKEIWELISAFVAFTGEKLLGSYFATHPK